MSKETIKIECEDCGGTGLYVGMAEHDGYAVVCFKCKGTGCVDFKYTPFTSKKIRTDIHTVISHNPGFIVGKLIGDKKWDKFGGMSYQKWVDGNPFPKGSEMRNFVCPKWWTYQKFQSRKCEGNIKVGDRYSDCKCFKDKALCWQEYDKEESEGK